MTSPRSQAELVALAHELSSLPRETECVEFKLNNARPEDIGEYISALSNSAALIGKARAYVIWGVEGTTKEIVGTTFEPAGMKGEGNEDLENWLTRHLTPPVGFRFHEGGVDGVRVVILELDAASHRPVAFKGQEFIRLGSYKKKLKDHPEKEPALWRIFSATRFEQGIAAASKVEEDVVRLLDYSAYFDLLEIPVPPDRAGILSALEADGLLRRSDAGQWDVTCLGAILFAKNLDDFSRLGRKAPRIIGYAGPGRTAGAREQVINRGYAAGFEGLVQTIEALLPANEVIEKALRRTVPMYPPLAVRELVANALIHQDFHVTGAGPMVEIFDGRMEITNPGAPLVPTDRMLDQPPKTRNEQLAGLMRRFGICEERGSGIDKVVLEIEVFQLPAPLFEAPGDNTRATLFAPKPLARMDMRDRIRACYLHACLRYVTGDHLTNASVRERFGIPTRNKAIASRLIRDAVDDKQIALANAKAGPKFRRYVPWWAVARAGTVS